MGNEASPFRAAAHGQEDQLHSCLRSHHEAMSKQQYLIQCGALFSHAHLMSSSCTV